ncbi:MAG: ShlB/FhaC/HecB family hemolysin secretion/activation protein [Acidovorax sp.]|uniref:ShlB/FhaC/HecB family hemolysin secretion/activation protein n=1 Tax=Acidovorax sp. TaxID=1872122 RepID=UPI00391D490A
MNPNRFRLVMNAARGALLTVVAAGNAHAQAPTSPPPNVRQQGEQLERLQQDREEAQRRQLQASPSALTPPASEQRRPWPEAESPCRAIQAVALVGDSSEAFRWVLADLIAGPDPAIGRCLGVGGVNVAAERAQQALVARGFVTSRIVFEPQNLASGRLTLTLLPGRIRAIRFATPDDRATAWNAVPAQPGDVLNLRDVEQALENFKRVPTAEADIQIEPADVPGQSDLVISWRQSLPFRLNVTMDDSGSKATGRYQGSATMSLDHGWTLNDLFYITVSQDLGGGQAGDRGTQGHTVHYSLPWDYGLLGFTQSASRYHQSVAGLNQDYVYSGQNDSADLKLSRLVYRDASRKTTASLKGWLRRSKNFIDDTEVQTQRRATGGWELGLAHREFVGRATLDVNLAHTGDAQTGIQPIFDKERVQKEIDAQIKITAEFGKSAASAWGKYANKKFVDAVAAGDEEAAGCWAPDGGCRAGGHALIGGLAGGAGGAAGAGLSSAAAPHVQAFLVANGVPDDAAKAIAQLSALGAGTAAGGAAGGAAGLNEASNNALVALPLLLESIAAGGAIAARACLTSPACVNALRLGGATVVAKIASLVDPADLAKIPGFGSTSPLPPVGPTIKPAEIQKIYGTPPLNEPQELKAWLGHVLDGYPADEAAKWAEDFVSTLPASQQQSISDFIMMSVQENAVAGSRREREVTADLLAQYPGGSVQNQQYLRDKEGNIVIDPNTGTARRLDHVVIVGGKVIEVVETTSLTADKDQQILHERETRRAGGSFIRDRETGKLVEVSDVSRIERRP